MSYLEIFDDLVSIVHTDYSGYIDKRGWDDIAPHRDKILELEAIKKLDEYSFKEIVDDYLLDFKDNHMHFVLKETGEQKLYDNGFRCRRYEDKLYVTHIGAENRLSKGMPITALDGHTILELGEKHKRQLQVIGVHPEREQWEPIIMKYSKCKVEDRQGSVFEIELKKYEKENYVPEYSVKTLENGIVIMTLTDFNNDDAINNLLKDKNKVLDECRNLIIDVRINHGGSDSAYMKLLDYLFDKEIELKDLQTDTMQLNMTERNYNLRVNMFKNYLKQINDEGTRKFIEAFLREIDKYRNQGLVTVDLNDAFDGVTIRGRKNPQHIVVLEDIYCGSSGDAFVEIAKMSDKVTLMGRGSAGVTDYSNLAVQEYGEKMRFMYPTSRVSAIDKGKGLTGVGVVPDIYIPWTPEHTERDVDMDTAVEYLLKK